MPAEITLSAEPGSVPRDIVVSAPQAEMTIDATVVTLFLSPDVNLKLRPKLWRELKPGARVVSYIHDMGDWAAQKVQNVEGDYGPRKLHLWIIPPDASR